MVRFSFSGDRAALVLPENLDKMSIEALITALDLRSRFAKEHDAWESSKTDVERRFQKILSQQITEIHAKIDGESEKVRAGLEEVVVREVLKLFP